MFNLETLLLSIFIGDSCVWYCPIHGTGAASCCHPSYCIVLDSTFVKGEGCGLQALLSSIGGSGSSVHGKLWGERFSSLNIVFVSNLYTHLIDYLEQTFVPHCGILGIPVFDYVETARSILCYSYVGCIIFVREMLKVWPYVLRSQRLSLYERNPQNSSRLFVARDKYAYKTAK